VCQAAVPELVSWLEGQRAAGPQGRLPVLLDFAGVETPWHAAEALGLPLRHVASSDCASGPQKYIFRNHVPEHFYTDVLMRSDEERKRLPIGAAPAPEVCLH